jgi:hypothetical protein
LIPGWALQKVFEEVGSETVNLSRMRVLRFGITQSKFLEKSARARGIDTSISQKIEEPKLEGV